MASSFGNVHVGFFDENCQLQSKSDKLFTVDVKKDAQGALLQFKTDAESLQCIYEQSHELARVNKQCLMLTMSQQSLLLKFSSENDMKSFRHSLTQTACKKDNVFDNRTDEASATQYFQFYGFLSQQQNMMQDYIRTSTYQRAMLANVHDFHDKVVLDVGAGSGILSFFAVQSGAAKVYAIEASSMALHCETLVRNNKLSGKIIVLPGKVEEVELPEKVDIIISEPMGYMLFNERMLESYLHAKKWLKPSGKMFPTVGDLHVSPFSDDALYMEQFSKANFWYQQSFHGVDLASLREAAVKEYFKQPIVDTFDIRICMARSVKYTVNFQTAHETDLHNIDIPLTFSMLQSGTIHGLAFWFDVAFLGTGQSVWLSTAPTEPLTHWYQVRCLLQQPVFVKQGQTVTGRVVLKANSRQSYDVDMEINIPGTNSKTVNSLDLKNPFFRYTGQQPAIPPGNNTTSPSDNYWNSLATGGFDVTTGPVVGR